MTGFEILALVSTIAGGAMSAMGTIAAGKATAAAAEGAAQQAEWQRKQNETRWKLEQGEKRIAADLAKRKKNLAISRAQNTQAGSGFDPSSHTSSIQIADLEKFGTFDEMMHLAGGQMARFEGQNVSAGLQMDADLYRMQAKDKSYMAGAAGTLIGSVGKGFGGLSGSSFLPSQATTTGWGATVSKASAPSAAMYHPYG